MPQYKRFLSKGIRWYYKFDYEGQTYHSKARYLSKQDAKKSESDKYRELLKSLTPDRDIKLFPLIDDRLISIKSARSKIYYNNSKSYLETAKHWFGNIKVSKIRKVDVHKLLISYSNKMQNRGNDNYSVNELLKAIKALFNYGINYHDLSVKNPCIGIQFFPIKVKMKYIPTDDEIKEVLELCDENQKMLLEFVRDTGCRISEALYLRHQDIYDEYVILHTRKSKYSNLMPRKVPRPTCIKQWNKDSTKRYFASWEKEPKFLPRKTKGKWSWHNLRHRYASLLSKNNIPIFEVMSLMGHSNLETTQRYLQLLV
ncbi:MAG: site-specific integrase [bacterium]